MGIWAAISWELFGALMSLSPSDLSLVRDLRLPPEERLSLLVERAYSALGELSFGLAAERLASSATLADLLFQRSADFHGHPAVQGRIHLRQHSVHLFRIQSVLNEMKDEERGDPSALWQGPVAVDLLLTMFLVAERFLEASQGGPAMCWSLRVEEGAIRRRVALGYSVDAPVLEKSRKRWEKGGLWQRVFWTAAAERPPRPVPLNQARDALTRAGKHLSWLLREEGATLEDALAPYRLLSLLPPHSPG
jgi:hypothetical protein